MFLDKVDLFSIQKKPWRDLPYSRKQHTGRQRKTQLNVIQHLGPVGTKDWNAILELSEEVLDPCVALHGPEDGLAVLELSVDGVPVSQVEDSLAVWQASAHVPGVGQLAIPEMEGKANTLKMKTHQKVLYHFWGR